MKQQQSHQTIPATTKPVKTNPQLTTNLNYAYDIVGKVERLEHGLFAGTATPNSERSRKTKTVNRIRYLLGLLTQRPYLEPHENIRNFGETDRKCLFIHLSAQRILERAKKPTFNIEHLQKTIANYQNTTPRLAQIKATTVAIARNVKPELPFDLIYEIDPYENWLIRVLTTHDESIIDKPHKTGNRPIVDYYKLPQTIISLKLAMYELECLWYAANAITDARHRPKYRKTMTDTAIKTKIEDLIAKLPSL